MVVVEVVEVVEVEEVVVVVVVVLSHDAVDEIISPLLQEHPIHSQASLAANGTAGSGHKRWVLAACDCIDGNCNLG
jgi:hypothetical protein